MPLEISRRAYVEMYGPTVGDQIRLADTDLWIEVERDLIAENGGYGNEVKFRRRQSDPRWHGAVPARTGRGIT